MNSQLIRLFICPIVFGISVAFTGCTGTAASRDVYSSEPSFILHSAKVVWVSDPTLSYEVTKISGLQQPTISARELAEAKTAMSLLIAALQKEVPTKLTARLAEHGVLSGDDIFIELKPVKGNYLVDNGRAVVIDMSIKRKGASSAMWANNLRSHAPRSTENSELIESFVSTAASELARNGWIK